VAHSMLNGIECSLLVFWIGAAFLSLEVFELPYLLLLLAAQTSLLIRFRATEAVENTVATAPVPTILQPRAS